MANFVNNYFDRENVNKRWFDHLQQEEYFDTQTLEITNAINYKFDETQEVYRTASKDQIIAYEAIGNNIANSVSDGFKMLTESQNENFADVKHLQQNTIEAIHELTFIVDWKLEQLIDLQQITIKYLGNIIALLKIPNEQKVRVYHIEQGLMYFKNAILEGVESDWHHLAEEEFMKALEIEKNDFFTLMRLGMIYLYSKVHNKQDKNFDKALYYFKESAKFSLAAKVAKGTHTLNNFNPSSNPFENDLAQSYLLAGKVLYLKGLFFEASKYAGLAFQAQPNGLHYLVNQSKFLSATNETTHVGDAVSLMEKAISKNRFIINVLNADKDFLKEEFVVMAKELNKVANEELSLALVNIEKYTMENSLTSEIVANVKSLRNNNRFLTAKKGLDILNRNYEWNFYDAILLKEIISGRDVYQVYAKERIFTETVEGFVKIEKSTSDLVKSLYKEAKEKNIRALENAVILNENFVKKEAEEIIGSYTSAGLALFIVGILLIFLLNGLTCNGNVHIVTW